MNGMVDDILEWTRDPCIGGQNNPIPAAGAWS